MRLLEFIVLAPPVLLVAAVFVGLKFRSTK